ARLALPVRAPLGNGLSRTSGPDASIPASRRAFSCRALPRPTLPSDSPIPNGLLARRPGRPRGGRVRGPPPLAGSIEPGFRRSSLQVRRGRARDDLSGGRLPTDDTDPHMSLAEPEEAPPDVLDYFVLQLA